MEGLQEMEKIEQVYLTEQEFDEITELKTFQDAINYIKDMPERKKQFVMKVFANKIAIRQWQTIASEKY